MKRRKAPGLSGLVAEMIQVTGDTGTQQLLDLCNGVVKEGCIPEDWKSSVVLPIYRGKGESMECGSYSYNSYNSSVSAITAKSSAYSISHGRATLNSLDMASMKIKNNSGLSAEPWFIPTFTSKPLLFS